MDKEEWPPNGWMEELKKELNSLFISYGPPNMTVSEVDVFGIEILTKLTLIGQKNNPQT